MLKYSFNSIAVIWNNCVLLSIDKMIQRVWLNKFILLQCKLQKLDETFTSQKWRTFHSEQPFTLINFDMDKSIVSFFYFSLHDY